MYLNNPEYVKAGNKKYKINTDFRVAIECNEIAESSDVSDTERPLAIIYKLFGDEGLDNPQDWEKLLELAIKYLCLGKDLEDTEEERDMDLQKDRYYIRSSFIQDYKYNPYDMEYLHWWDFFNDLSNLSNSEFGNCCILNRVRNLRTMDVSKIKDWKEKNRILKAKRQVSLIKEDDVEKEMTEEEKESQNRFYNALGGD
jgi:hypothetical protein|nr:MAG TPA: hypothetical protein [Caudoviricetes sp.]DAM80565.1 MAG TPA: hypothetical protein [Bacteriophage sp.]